MKIILNPAILYNILWMFLIVLYKLHLSQILLPLNQESLIFFGASMIAFIFGYILILVSARKLIIKPKINLDLYKKWLFSRNTTKVVKILAWILCIGLFIEILYFKNLPLLSALGIGITIRYTEFGFPGIHGLFNAIFLVIFLVIWGRQIISASIPKSLLLLLILSWPLFLLTRQLLVSAIIQGFFLLCLLKGINTKRFINLIIFFFGFVLLFGYLGDLRAGSDRDFFIALARPTFDYPDYLPAGLLWVYIYFTSPLNNVINNLDITPYYAPISIILGLFPSFVRNYANDFFQSASSWELVNETFNVSSLHQKFLQDFGSLATPIMYIFISAYFSNVMYLARKNPQYGFALVVVLHNIFFSFFTDFIFHLVFLAQFIIFILLFPKISRINFQA